MQNEVTKECKKCKKIKVLSEFVRNAKNKTHGVRPVCKICVNRENSIKYKAENPKPGSHRYNLINHKFDKLTVIQKNGYDKYKNILWLCECECGNFCSVTTTVLNRRKKTSCGCNQYKYGEKTYNYTGYKEITGAKWYSIKSGAAIRDLEFNITKEEVWIILEKQKFLCYFSNLPISFLDKTASVDRLDSSIGYVLDNIVLVHKDINKMKMDFTVARFEELCKLVSNKKR